MSVIGTRVERREDPAFLTAGGVYTADVRGPPPRGGGPACTFVRSTMAHGPVTELDVSEAAAAPGVLAVYTAADLTEADDLSPFPVAIPA